MRTLFDTSVLVAAMERSHPAHPRAAPWLARARTGEFQWFVASHTLAETYAVLTVLPVRPRISPATAKRLIESNILDSAKVVPLSAKDYRRTIESMASLDLAGGVIYDALLARAAKNIDARRVLTLNVRDFERAWPEGRGVLVSP